MCNSELRNVGEIPPTYRSIFNEYPCFNAVQSRVLDDVLYSDDSVVVSAPTGAGKTAIFELAMVRLLIQYDNVDISQQLKVVYICPMKSLCQERLVDWHKKFSKFGVNCVSVTGDSDNIDFQNLINHNLIISTPEKWDSLTRRWKDNEKIVKVVKLFMIDEVHLLNEENRGSTLEVIVSRMKTVENSVASTVDDSGIGNQKIRFIALSATVPNVEDIAEWIGKPPNIKYYRFSEEMRPVKLKKIILGYSCNPKTTPFKFDLSLNYKLQSLMIQYSEGKPTLIFCSTRKSVEMTANHIVQSLKIHLTREQTNKLLEAASRVTDGKAKQTLKHGVGYHHAGLIPETRQLIENLFRNGDLPVLVTTSTLAMGVNLPAHLVIIKSTKCYDNCGFRDYTETAIHQMIGRAGRPQFDTSATALILTTNDDKHKFEQMVGCGQPIESNLHRHLTEHLNAEVVLRTITDLDVAMRWLASTFLYVRARKNPHHYGLNVGLGKEQIDKKLLEMCQIDLNKLVAGGMITMDQNIVITPTTTGQIMAKYYVAFETMKLFTQISGTEILIQILALISKCHEFSEMRLRVNDKKSLNLFNKNSKKTTIRFPLNGRIKTRDMKVNCIIQAVLGNLDILDHSLLSESFTIMRNGARISKCLIEYLGTRRTNCYSALLNTLILAKCFQAKLWENSPYVCKQLSGIGSVTSNQLVNVGKTTFQKILESNPRDIEMSIKRKPPMGNLLIEEVRHIPRYEMTLEKVDNQNQLKLTIDLVNSVDLQEKSTVNVKSVMTLLVGNNLNEILVYEKYQHSYMMEINKLVKFIRVNTDHLDEVNAHFISEDWVGIDCNCSVPFISSDTGTKNGTVNNGNCKDKKAPTYIQMFLDMYMKTKKKSMEVVQKKQKVKKDDTSQAGKVTKEPKKIAEKTNTPINEGKINKKTNTNISEESKISTANSAIVAAADVETSRPNQFQSGNEDVADEDGSAYLDLENWDDVTLGDISSSSSNTRASQPNQYQEIKDNVHVGLEHRENVALGESFNTSSTSLFSNKSATTMDNNDEHKGYEDLEAMEADETCEENAQESDKQLDSDEGALVIDKMCEENAQEGDKQLHSDESALVIDEMCEENEQESERRLVIDEGPIVGSQNVFNFEGKVNKDRSLSKNKYKYRTAPHCKWKTRNSLGLVDPSRKENNKKRPAAGLGGFKFPPKKKFNHRQDLENLPDSTHDLSTTLRPLQPNNRNNFNTSTSSQTYSKSSSQSNENKENIQKGIRWRSPLVYSPAAKHSPKMSFPSRSTSRDNPETDTQNDPENETFETTSSMSPVNLTLNIQRTPRQTKNSPPSRNKRQGTKFPLRDKDYAPINNGLDMDIDDLCSEKLKEMLGMLKKVDRDIPESSTGTLNGENKKISPTVDYYSQLVGPPVQSQKQNTETTPKTRSSDRNTYEENVPNNSEANNTWNSSTISENAPQNISDDLGYEQNYHQVNSRNPQVTKGNSIVRQDATDTRAFAKQLASDVQMCNRTLILAHNTSLQRNIQDNSDEENFNPWNPNPNYQWSANSHGQDVTSQNLLAGFVPPTDPSDHIFSNRPRQDNETFVSHNYPGDYNSENTQGPVSRSEEQQNFSRHLARLNYHQTTTQPGFVDSFPRTRPSEYFENNSNLHDRSVSGFVGYERSRDSQLENYVSQQSVMGERMHMNRFATSSTNEPWRSPSEVEQFAKVLLQLKKGHAVPQIGSHNFTQGGFNSESFSQGGPSQVASTRSNHPVTSNTRTSEPLRGNEVPQNSSQNFTQGGFDSESFPQAGPSQVATTPTTSKTPKRRARPARDHNRPIDTFLREQMLNRPSPFYQYSLLQQPGAMNNEYDMRNLNYAQSWALATQQNMYDPNNHVQMHPYYYQGGYNVPLPHPYQHYYQPHLNDIWFSAMTDEDKRYLMNQFLQSNQQKKK